MRTIDPTAAFHRWCDERESTLDPYERLVVLVMSFEASMDMQSWDYFWSSEFSRPLLPELKAGLRAADDRGSLQVIEDFERWLTSHGVDLESGESIDEFLDRDIARNDPRDFRDEFTAHIESRWDRIAAYLAQHDIELLR